MTQTKRDTLVFQVGGYAKGQLPIHVTKCTIFAKQSQRRNGTTRLQGRPKSRWDDNVKEDICKMKIKNWTVCVQDRGKWRDVVEKAKPFNI
jgi:hypothetical protein